jgi:DNA topoisomerase VI subunit B
MAYQHMKQQPCDSYFVESDDASYSRAPQDFLKIMGRRKQEAMADELSRQASEDYIDDIVNHMKQMEVIKPWLPNILSLYADLPCRMRLFQTLPR